MKQQILYRFWKGNHLLYVGISVSFFHRMSEHRRTSPWWEQADRVTIERFATRVDVRAAETAAIRTEFPEFNIQQSVTPINGVRKSLSDAPWPAFSTPRDIKDRLGVSPDILASRRKRGELPRWVLAPNGRPIYSLEAIEEWLDDSRRPRVARVAA